MSSAAVRAVAAHRRRRYLIGVSDGPDNLLLVYLRRIDAKVDRNTDDLREVMHRLTAIDISVAGLRRDIAALSEADAHLSARVDKMSDRLERIERRLDILAES